MTWIERFGLHRAEHSTGPVCDKRGRGEKVAEICRQGIIGCRNLLAKIPTKFKIRQARSAQVGAGLPTKGQNTQGGVMTFVGVLSYEKR